MAQGAASCVEPAMSRAWLFVFAACGGSARVPSLSPPPIGLEPLAGSTCGTQLRAASPGVGPARPHARWVRKLPGDWIFALSADHDGGVIATQLDGVVAVDRDGGQRWKRAVTVEPRTKAVIGGDGAYVGLLNDRFDYDERFHSARGGVMRLDDCGQPAWMFHARPQNGHTPAVADDGMIYFSGHERVLEAPERIYAVRRDGSVVWSREAGDTVTSPVIADHDEVVFGTNRGAVIALDRNGRVRWQTTPIANIVWNASFGPDGSIYAIYDRTLVVLDRDGHERWRQPIGGGATPAPVFADDGTSYVGGDQLSAFSPDGTRRWQLDLHGFVVQAVVARDGIVFAASADPHEVGRVFAIAPDGAIRWMYFTEQPGALALGGDNVLYVAAGRRIYALGECATSACEDDGTTIAALGEPPPVIRAQAASAPPPPAPQHGEPHDGFAIFPSCRPNVTAVVSTIGEPFAWLSHTDATAKATATREDFRGRALAAIRARSHSSGFGGGCVERAAMAISVYPGEDVEAAALRLGAWLVQTAQRGEVDVIVEDEPRAL
jgi:outer membrane protein assembly factor BamB